MPARAVRDATTALGRRLRRSATPAPSASSAAIPIGAAGAHAPPSSTDAGGRGFAVAVFAGAAAGAFPGSAG